jgi:hypothetical protein
MSRMRGEEIINKIREENEFILIYCQELLLLLLLLIFNINNFVRIINFSFV